MRSHFSNLVHTCPDGMGAMLVGTGGQGSSISFLASNSMWFNSFPGKGHNKWPFFDFPRALNPITLIHKKFSNLLVRMKAKTEIYNP